MSTSPTEPRYSTSRRPLFPPRPAPVLTAFLLLLGILIAAMLAWWIF